MILLFVHGWSVSNTNTYGELPEAVRSRARTEGITLDIRHIYLGKYISFHDEVTVDDIARAFDFAIKEQIPQNADGMKEFSCITHSTGGPVVRKWIDNYYGKSKRLKKLPLRHLIMLAPANFGSALAKLGKERIGRIKAWFQGVEPGERVLQWLELGSPEQARLNVNWLNYPQWKNLNFYPVVLTGQTIDKKLYDYLNSYTAEPGSDGVVRVCAANLNYRRLKLQQGNKLIAKNTLELVPVPDKQGKTVHRSPETAMGVMANTSHSGTKIGIMRSVKKGDTNKPVVKRIVQSLKINDYSDYLKLSLDLDDQTDLIQQNKSRYVMLVFSVKDDRGEELHDYDILLLAGKKYKPNLLEKGFFQDRQATDRLNQKRVVYYLNVDKMRSIKDGKLGLRVVPRPDKGFSYYQNAEFHSEDIQIRQILKPNQTLMVDIELKRFVDKNVFRFDKATAKRKSFKNTKPSKKVVE